MLGNCGRQIKTSALIDVDISKLQHMVLTLHTQMNHRKGKGTWRCGFTYKRVIHSSLIDVLLSPEMNGQKCVPRFSFLEFFFKKRSPAGRRHAVRSNSKISKHTTPYLIGLWRKIKVMWSKTWLTDEYFFSTWIQLFSKPALYGVGLPHTIHFTPCTMWPDISSCYILRCRLIGQRARGPGTC